jgi:hypothetical protein
VSTVDAPGSDVAAQVEVLFREARARRRRRWLVGISVVFAMGAVGAGIAVGLGGLPAKQPPRSAQAPFARRPASLNAARTGRPYVLRANGLGSAAFGQSESIAIKELTALLGQPETAEPRNMKGNCTIDAEMDWRGLSAYFFGDVFVGYATGSLLGGPAFNHIPNATTADGLRIGDPLAQAQSLYGGMLATSYAQGGSWTISTPEGAFRGLLTTPLSDASATPRIGDISAGSVGCPAVTP